MSPTFWRVWHNDYHHNRTQQGSLDPFTFQTYKEVENSRFQKFIFKLTPGSGSFLSTPYLFGAFFIKGIYHQFYLHLIKRKYPEVKTSRMLLEVGVQVAIFSFWFLLMGETKFIYLLAGAFIFQNFIVGSHFLCTRAFSPLIEENDPFKHTTNFKYNLTNFFSYDHGYHIEHSLFPNVPFNKLRKIAKYVQNKYDDKYKVVSRRENVRRFFKVPHVYKNNNEFIHPDNLKSFHINSSK